MKETKSNSNMIEAKTFSWSSRNMADGKFWVFYYCKGMGFETGQKVYYGKNVWNSEEKAIADQEVWEKRVGNS